MVDIMGHVAMGLLWALPTWVIWDTRVTLAFLGFVVPALLLPDIDLWIERIAPSLIHHLSTRRESRPLGREGIQHDA